MHNLAENRNTTSNNNFTINETHLSVSATGRARATTKIHRASHGLFRYTILCNCSIDHAWCMAPTTPHWNAAHWKHVACISFTGQHTKIYGLTTTNVNEEERQVVNEPRNHNNKHKSYQIEMLQKSQLVIFSLFRIHSIFALVWEHHRDRLIRREGKICLPQVKKTIKI